jgi:inosose dehydratase
MSDPNVPILRFAQDEMSRRAFIGTVASTAIASCLGKAHAGARKLKIGHTGITWGYAPQNAEAAIRDIAAAGYQHFESFGSVLAWWESRGGLKTILDQHGVALRSAYCPFELTDSTKRNENVANASRWGRLIRAAGGTIAVVGPNSVKRPGFSMGESRAQVVSALNDIGRALNDAGVIPALHPHSGSCVQSRDDVDQVMGHVNLDLMKLAPDVGELTACGADPLPILKNYLPVIHHVHLKDYSVDAQTHDGYCPLGEGHVDIGGAIDVVEETKNDVMMMVELNPDANGRGPSPLETARTSRRFLEKAGYTFTS